MQPLRSCVLLLVIATACGQPRPATSNSTAANSRQKVDADHRPLILCLGTSLTVGLGVPPDSAWPARLQRMIDSAGLTFRVVNAGLSGETSAGALRRLDWVLTDRPSMVIVETGANDGLRGQDPDSTRGAIQSIINRLRTLSPAPSIVIAGMEALPNYGADYGRRFHAIYPALAHQNHLHLIPFLLEGVGGVDSLVQADGVHPTSHGHQIVAATVWRIIRPVLDSLNGLPALSRSPR